VGVIGASRSGKSAWVIQQVAAAPRLLLWDYKGEHRRYRCRLISTFAELHACSLPGAEPERLAFHCLGMSDRRLFASFCGFAFVWLRGAIGTLVLEETASVTSPGKAATAYGDVLRMGLGWGCDIYAITQRPQESDKTAYGNATVLHCHQLGNPGDCRYVARNFMPVPIEQLEALKPLQWIERRNTGELARGVVQLRKARRKA
jgi:hypothetical protein